MSPCVANRTKRNQVAGFFVTKLAPWLQMGRVSPSKNRNLDTAIVSREYLKSKCSVLFRAQLQSGLSGVNAS